MNANIVFHIMILKKTEDICGKVSRQEKKNTASHCTIMQKLKNSDGHVLCD